MIPTLKKEPDNNNQQAEKQLKQVRQDISNQTQSELQKFSKSTPILVRKDHENTSTDI